MITIIEKLLDQAGGHQKTQIKAIENLLTGEGLIILTARNSDVLLPTTYNIQRVLSSRKEQRKSGAKAFHHDVAVLKNIFLGPNYLMGMRVLIPTAEKHEFLVCMKLLAKNATRTGFVLRVLSHKIIEKLADTERADLHSYIEAGSITLVTETESLADLLQTKYGLRAHNKFLLPCSIDPSDSVPQRGAGSRSHFKIGYLGVGRKEKGLAKLPTILAGLKTLLNASDTDVSLEIVMQTVKHKTMLRRLIFNYKLGRSLRNASKPEQKISLTSLGEELPPEAFVAAIHSVDLLLIPYELKAYHARGSGIIIDGVLAEKPIVYTDGIGMNEFLGFGNAAAAADLAEFAPKIMTVVQNLEAYRAKTPLARKALRAQIQKSAEFLAGL